MNPATPSKPSSAPAAGGAVLRRMRIEMGTGVVIEAHAPTAAQAQAGTAAGFAAVARVAALMNPQLPAGDLHRISAAPAGTRLPVHPNTAAILRFAHELHRLSEGIFDPCLPHRRGTLAQLEIEDGAAPAVICHAPVAIDCGGFAKGYAVDCAVAALREAGCTAGVVNAGGDLRVFGALREPVLLRRAEAGFEPLELENAALAVSDRDAREAPPGHRGYYVRGAPAAQRRYAAVRASAAMTADALTKCVLLAPPVLAEAILAALGAECLA